MFVLINLLLLRNLPHSMSPHELPFGLNCKKTGLIALLFLYCLLLLCYVVIVGHYLRYLNTNRKISSVMVYGGVGMIVFFIIQVANRIALFCQFLQFELDFALSLKPPLNFVARILDLGLECISLHQVSNISVSSCQFLY